MKFGHPMNKNNTSELGLITYDDVVFDENGIPLSDRLKQLKQQIDNLDSANIAQYAINDYIGQRIDSTYIKNLSVSGRIITFTKGDNTKGTIQTQDTNDTTYIKNLSVSGKTITYTRGNGVTGNIETQDTTYVNAVASSGSFPGVDGLMSASDKALLVNARNFSKFTPTLYDKNENQITTHELHTFGSYVTIGSLIFICINVFADFAPDDNGVLYIGNLPKLFKSRNDDDFVLLNVSCSKDLQSTDSANVVGLVKNNDDKIYFMNGLTWNRTTEPLIFASGTRPAFLISGVYSIEAQS